jgi:hypothetical protein
MIHKDEKSLGNTYTILAEKKKMMQTTQGLHKYLGRKRKVCPARITNL